MVLALVVLSLCKPTNIFAENRNNQILTKENAMDVEAILTDYHVKIAELYSKDNLINKAYNKSGINIIQSETVSKLRLNGYDAYNVTPDTFDEISNILSTDLIELGLDPQYSYIIVVNGEDSTDTQSSAGSSFSYSYNGSTYKMRYLTVSAADDPSMGKTTTVDLLRTTSRTLIENCLNTIISAAVSSASKTLGTVASICGLSISNFSTAQTSTLYLNGGTNWTRIYTQVWSSYLNAWTRSSCVEYATGYAFLSGLYYSASLNRFVDVPAQRKSETFYSSHYSDTTWRKQNAVIGFLNSYTVTDLVGDVRYKYGGSVKITHYENF